MPKIPFITAFFIRASGLWLMAGAKMVRSEPTRRHMHITGHDLFWTACGCGYCPACKRYASREFDKFIARQNAR